MPNKFLYLFFILLSLKTFAQDADVDVSAAGPTQLPAELVPAEPVVVKFNDADLPSESVTPIVDSPRAVLSRKVKFESRFEFSLNYGWLVDEMFVNANQIGGKFLYHFDELNGLGLIFNSRFGGNTDYANQFDADSKLKFNRAPAPTTMVALGFDQKFYYGKVSVGKDRALVTVTESNFVVGVQKNGTQQLPVASIGLTQRFFLNKHVSVGLSYRALFQQIFDPTTVNLRESQPIPEEGSFTKKYQSSQVLGLTSSYLF